jgi:tetratricopeptide (TPR) repeat protein
MQLFDRYDQGLIFAPYFDVALEKFERGQESFYQYFPVMLKGIQLEEEKRRPETIARLRSEIDARRAAARAVTDAEATAKVELRGLLVRANEHILANRFDEARDLLEKVLKQDPANASALYGMAQIAGRAQNLELALSLYARAAENAGDERWIAGWSHIRRGNIYEFLGDPASARKEWSKVHELQGDLRGAREAASKALLKN